MFRSFFIGDKKGVGMEDIVNSFLLIYSTFVPVLNPFGGAMFFLALTPNIDFQTRKMMVNKIVFYSALILLASLFAGHIILSFFGISMGVLRVGGGMVLMAAGWKALNAEANGDENAKLEPPKSPAKLVSMAFYPITLPMTMGPGMISVATAVGSTTLVEGLTSIVGLILAIIATLLTIFFLYRYCDKFNEAFGASGADALARVFAFILLCIGISQLWQGFSELWLGLPH